MVADNLELWKRVKDWAILRGDYRCRSGMVKSSDEILSLVCEIRTLEEEAKTAYERGYTEGADAMRKAIIEKVGQS